MTRRSRSDIGGVRQHCTQCLTEVFAGGKQAPSGETLCASCYAALWGPAATEELRSLVRLHTGLPKAPGAALAARS
jgi:hypothetical protein